MNLLYEGKLYGMYLLEYLLSNRIMDLQALNIFDVGIGQDEIELGLEYLTVTNYLTREKPNGWTQ